MATIETMIIRVGANTRPFDSAMNRAERRIRKLGNNMKAVGRTMTKAITLPLLGIGVGALKMSFDFNEAMANVGTLIPGNIDRVNELKKSVQDMAISTGKSTGDLARGLFQVISAFEDSSETAKILGIVARTATAGLSTTEQALTLVSAITKGYGDTTAEAVQKAADLAFVTNKLGQTTFPELAASMGRAVPIAAALGLKQEELFAVFAAGTGPLGTAAEVTTGLRGALQALLSPTDKMKKLFDDFGVASGRAAIKQFGLLAILEEVLKRTDDGTKDVNKFIGSIEGQIFALGLAGGQADAFTRKLKAMFDSTGAQTEAFDQITGGVNKAGFEFKQFTQKVVVTIQRLGDDLAPVLGEIFTLLDPLVEKVRDLIKAFSDLDPKVKANIVGIGILAGLMGPFLITLGLFNIALASTLSLFSLLAIKVIIVVGGFILLNEALVGFAELFAGGQKIPSLLDLIGEGIKKVIDEAIELSGINDIVTKMEKAMSGLNETMKETGDATRVVELGITKVAERMGFFERVIFDIKAKWTDFTDKLKAQTEAMSISIQGSIQNMMTNIAVNMLTGAGDAKFIMISFIDTILRIFVEAAIAASGIAELLSQAITAAFTPGGFILIAGLIGALLLIRKGLATRIKAESQAERLHEGGIAGGGPSRFGGGLRSDEVQATLRRGEGVFTPEQMAAMGQPIVNQTLEFNISAVDGASVERVLRINAGTILRIVGEGVKRSRSFAVQLKSA